MTVRVVSDTLEFLEGKYAFEDVQNDEFALTAHGGLLASREDVVDSE